MLLIITAQPERGKECQNVGGVVCSSGMKSPNVEGYGMPSFSRSGRTSSNRLELAVVKKNEERARAEKTRARSQFSYRSLADVEARTSNFREDLGRAALVCSSPRIDDAPTQEGKGDGPGLAFQRVVLWSQVPGEDYDPSKPPAAANRSVRGTGNREEKKPVQKDRPNHFFLATERGAPNDYLEQFNKQNGKLAPPVGYYDAKLEVTKPSGPKLGYIVQNDRPHAPTVRAETLLNETLAKSKKELTMKGKSTPTTRDGKISPRVAVRLLRDKDPNVLDLSQYSFENPKKRTDKKPAAAPAQQQEDEDDERPKTSASPSKGEAMSVVGSPPKHRPRTCSPTSGSRVFDKAWDASHITIDMKGRTARNKEGTGVSTCTGYLMSAAQSADVWYRPSFEVMEISNRRVPTPDLSRSGKDYDDQLLKLGFRLPEDLAQVPFYSKVDGAMDWSDMPKWYAATNLMDNRTTVQIGKQTARRSIAEKGIDTGIRIQCRKPTRSMNTIACKKHPTYQHVQGFDMQKSSSAHGEITAVKSITTKLDYNPSQRLQMKRTTGILPIKKMGVRRPMTADPFTGKPVFDTLDMIYDTKEEIIKPRSRQPVDMRRRPGRESWPRMEQSTAAGGLTGLTYWEGVEQLTSSTSQLKKKALPNLALTQGREARNPLDAADREARFFAATLDAKITEPISKIGKTHFHNGHKTGALWHPK